MCNGTGASGASSGPTVNGVSEKEGRAVVSYLKGEMRAMGTGNRGRDYRTVSKIPTTSDGLPRYAVHFTDDKGKPNEYNSRIDVVRGKDGKLEEEDFFNLHPH